MRHTHTHLHVQCYGLDSLYTLYVLLGARKCRYHNIFYRWFSCASNLLLTANRFLSFDCLYTCSWRAQTQQDPEPVNTSRRETGVRTPACQIIQVRQSAQMVDLWHLTHLDSEPLTLPLAESDLRLIIQMRQGTGPGWLFVCLFVGIKPQKLFFASCWEGSKPPGSDHTRAEAQTTCVPKTAAQTTYLSIYGYRPRLRY